MKALTLEIYDKMNLSTLLDIIEPHTQHARLHGHEWFPAEGRKAQELSRAAFSYCKADGRASVRAHNDNKGTHFSIEVDGGFRGAFSDTTFFSCKINWESILVGN